MSRKLSLFSLLLLVLAAASAPADFPQSSQTDPIAIKEVEPFAYFSVSHKGPFTEIQNVVGQLLQASQSQNVYPAGPMIGIYYTNPAQTKAEDLEWEMGFPVTPQALVQAPLNKKEWTFKTVVSSMHTGSYETTGDTIAKMLEWMNANRYAQTGPILETYLDMDPSKAKPENLKTEIWIPCKKIT